MLTLLLGIFLILLAYGIVWCVYWAMEKIEHRRWKRFNNLRK